MAWLAVWTSSSPAPRLASWSAPQRAFPAERRAQGANVLGGSRCAIRSDPRGSELDAGRRQRPQVDQGALLRLLGEMMWFPTAFADSRYVSWTTIDDQSAEAHTAPDAKGTEFLHRAV
jgi:hypothetical protein